MWRHVQVQVLNGKYLHIHILFMYMCVCIYIFNVHVHTCPHSFYKPTSSSTPSTTSPTTPSTPCHLNCLLSPPCSLPILIFSHSQSFLSFFSCPPSHIKLSFSISRSPSSSLCLPCSSSPSSPDFFITDISFTKGWQNRYICLHVDVKTYMLVTCY